MGDFLEQFTNKSYNEQKPKDRFLESGQESNSQEVDFEPDFFNSKIYGPVHDTMEDNSYHSRQTLRYGIVGGSLFAVAIIVFIMFNISNRVEVPDFTNHSLAEVRTWELANRISLVISSEFSLEIEEGFVISQDRAFGDIIRRGGILNLVISLGADPEEPIDLPDFTDMTIQEIRIWRNNMQAMNISINEEYSNEVEAGRFIRKEFVNRYVNLENYTRADGLLVFISQGVEEFPKNIVVQNFIGSNKDSVTQWADTNDITIIFEEETSKTVPVNNVISQSISSNERIARYTEMTVVLSLGMSVIVPDFATIPQNEARDVSGFTITIQERFHESIPFGHLISQSEPVGKELLGDSSPLTLVYSIGRPFMEDIRGQAENVLPEIFFRFTSRGANITYTVVYVNSYETRGEIVNPTRFNQWLAMEDHVNIYVSLGNLHPPPLRIPEE
ncbi:MAG: PASTA domain-containing protein [Lachnospiraceae bacterium]|nr:PASTA domain-containing protein [Lachnospiraceae bacterium]